MENTLSNFAMRQIRLEQEIAEDYKAQVAELLDALKHAVNWGHGFEGTGTRPAWLTEAEEAIRKVQP